MVTLFLWRCLNNKCAVIQRVYMIEKILIAVIIAANDKIVTTKENVINSVGVRFRDIKCIQFRSVFNAVNPERFAGRTDCKYRTVLCDNLWRIRNKDRSECTAIGKIQQGEISFPIGTL